VRLDLLRRLGEQELAEAAGRMRGPGGRATACLYDGAPWLDAFAAAGAFPPSPRLGDDVRGTVILA
jgi:hypothetical protein